VNLSALQGADLQAIEEFLKRLQITPRGRVVAVNILESVENLLFSAEKLAKFFLDCLQTSAAFPVAGGVAVIEDVSCGHGVNGHAYLRECAQIAFSSGEKCHLSNVMTTTNFRDSLIDNRHKVSTDAVLPQWPEDSPSGEEEYRVLLEEVTSNPGWYRPAATIGRPFSESSNCWITSDQFGANPHEPSYPGETATKIRDELGLIHLGHGSWLLRLTFLASDLAAITTCELARPTFADLGNSRFRVNQTSQLAAILQAEGWGATVHLGKFGDLSFTDYTGASERVSTPLPLSALRGLRVEFLGRVNGSRGIQAEKDDDEAFAKDATRDSNGRIRTSEEIRDRILSLLG
jgi:hypothetical protein